MIQRCERSNLAAFDWPATPDGNYARRYLRPFIEDGPGAYIANAHTQMQVVRAGACVLPLTVSEFHPQNSYVCSPYSHYVSYGQEEFAALKNRPLEACLRLLFLPLAAYFRRAELDKAVYVNNWLLSTNLYPALPAGLPAALTQHLMEACPDRAIVFRSVDGLANGPLLATLREGGARLVFSRSVWYQTPGSPHTLERHNYKLDQQLLRQTPYRILTAEQLGDADAGRIVQLYSRLYIDKYSQYNPRFTEAFIRMALAEGLLTLKAFQRDGRIDAVLGYFCRNGVGTPPLFGYDTALPRTLGLYRLLSALFSQEAARQGFLVNFSAGVGDFKRKRGCRNAIEYNAVFCRHLPPARQRAWKLLQALMDRVAIPIIQRRGF
jgi:hypothetical protein